MTDCEDTLELAAGTCESGPFSKFKFILVVGSGAASGFTISGFPSVTVAVPSVVFSAPLGSTPVARFIPPLDGEAEVKDLEGG